MDQNKVLERFVIYLKNVIFFKCIVYFLCIGLLIWLLQIFNDGFMQSIDNVETAQRSLDNATAKLSSIMGSDIKTQEAYHLYEDILQRSDKQRCETILNLVLNLRNLANKYHLADPLDIKMTQSFLVNTVQSAAGNGIKIKNYDLRIQFCAQDFNTAVSVIHGAYLLMPEHSIIWNLELEEQEVLTPKLINKLITTRYPDLINAVFNMRVREMVVNRY